MIMETKQCIACKEDILKTALKCKHCAQVQSRAANLPNKPLYNYCIFGLFALFILWLLFEFMKLYNYEETKPVFDITESKFHSSESKKGLNIRCIAEVENTHVDSWSNFSLQANFKNSNGDIIDVLYDKTRMSLHSSYRFKGMVSGYASATSKEYSSCELSILDWE